MNDAGDYRSSEKLVVDEGWLEPFRVFFDRSFSLAFSTAIEMSNGDEGAAAQACAFAYSRAYSRWMVLGRIGDGDAFIGRRLARGLKRSSANATKLDAGVGFKPWVYVTAIESGAARKHLSRLATGALAAAMTVVIGVSALSSETPSNDVSISGDTTSSSIAPVPSSLAPTSLPPVASTAAPELDWNGFTLDLNDLPKSPAEITADAQGKTASAADVTSQTGPFLPLSTSTSTPLTGAVTAAETPAN